MKPDTRCYAARVDNLDAVTRFVGTCADRFGLDDGTRFRLLLALEEAFVNVCRYAYPEGTGAAEVTCESDGGAFALAIADRGRPFDVLSLPEPDTRAGVMLRPVGGLGVHFIRTCASSASYRRDDGRNILRMVFRPAESGDQP